MSDSTQRSDRTITVETAELGPVRVRRLSLGGMARIAERLRAEGNDNEIALGDALVAEVIVAGMEGDPLPGEHEPDPFDTARLALLSEQDRRSIAAAVLTLEGVKAAGDDVVEDPRSVLARRYSHVLDLGSRPEHTATARLLVADERLPGAPAESAESHPQIALFEGMIPPAATPAQTGGGTDNPKSSSRGNAWEKEKAELLADIADLQELVALERERNDDLQDQLAGQHAREPRSGLPALSAEWLERYRWPAVAVLSAIVLAVIAQFIWIASLRSEMAEQRIAFETRAAEQQKALDEANRQATQANARADQLAGELAALQAKQKAAAARVSKPAARATRSGSKTTTSRQRTR